MTNKIAILLTSATLALSGPALVGVARAQDTASQASATRDDTEKLALARRMVELNGGQAAADAQIKSMLTLMGKSLSQYMPPDQATVANAVYAEMEQEMSDLVPQLIDISVRAYAENYTTQELADMVAFQSSPSGRSIAAKAPAVREQAMSQTIPLVMAAMPSILHKTIERACTQSHCTPEQRQVVETAMAKAFQRPGA